MWDDVPCAWCRSVCVLHCTLLSSTYIIHVLVWPVCVRVRYTKACVFTPVVIPQCVSDIGLGTTICMPLGWEREADVRWGSHSCHQRCQTVGRASGQHHSAHTPFFVCVCEWACVLHYTVCAAVDSCDLMLFLFLGGGQEVWLKSNDCHMLLRTHTHTKSFLTGAWGSDVLISAETSTLV